MPILVKCSCGKSVNVRDELAGKAIKCPGCAQAVKVPSKPSQAPSAASPSAKPAAARSSQAAQQAAAPQRASAPAPASTSLSDLFAEEGFNRHVAAVCPNCRTEMTATAVLCTKCGYNKQTGTRLESHKTAGVDIDHGTLALMKAESDMHIEREMQEKLISAGVPWWVTALILFLLMSATTIAVITVNAARRLDGSGFTNPLGLFLVLGASAFFLIAQGATFVICIKAFQKNVTTGLMVMFVPFYILYFVFKHLSETWKLLAVGVVCSLIGIGFAFAAVSAGI